MAKVLKSLPPQQLFAGDELKYLPTIVLIIIDVWTYLPACERQSMLEYMSADDLAPYSILFNPTISTLPVFTQITYLPVRAYCAYIKSPLSTIHGADAITAAIFRSLWNLPTIALTLYNSTVCPPTLTFLTVTDNTNTEHVIPSFVAHTPTQPMKIVLTYIQSSSCWRWYDINLLDNTPPSAKYNPQYPISKTNTLSSFLQAPLPTPPTPPAPIQKSRSSRR
jgi:hypothetical protein